MRGDSDLESEPMFALLIRLFTNLWRNQRDVTPFINNSMGFDSIFGSIKLCGCLFAKKRALLGTCEYSVYFKSSSVSIFGSYVVLYLVLSYISYYLPLS